MPRDYVLWLATDGEIRAGIEPPGLPGLGGSRSRQMRWLPSPYRFSKSEAIDAITLVANRSRYDRNCFYLNGGGVLGSGPWPADREAELLEAFERALRTALKSAGREA